MMTDRRVKTGHTHSHDSVNAVKRSGNASHAQTTSEESLNVKKY